MNDRSHAMLYIIYAWRRRKIFKLSLEWAYFLCASAFTSIHFLISFRKKIIFISLPFLICSSFLNNLHLSPQQEKAMFCCLHIEPHMYHYMPTMLQQKCPQGSAARRTGSAIPRTGRQVHAKPRQIERAWQRAENARRLKKECLSSTQYRELRAAQRRHAAAIFWYYLMRCGKRRIFTPSLLRAFEEKAACAQRVIMSARENATHARARYAMIMRRELAYITQTSQLYTRRARAANRPSAAAHREPTRLPEVWECSHERATPAHSSECARAWAPAQPRAAKRVRQCSQQRIMPTSVRRAVYVIAPKKRAKRGERGKMPKIDVATRSLARALLYKSAAPCCVCWYMILRRH